MFLESLRTTSAALIQIILLAAVGFFLVKRRILDDIGLGSLSRLLVEVTLPVLIFCQLVNDFSFRKYPDWWVFPLLSLAITLVGLAAAGLFIKFIHGGEHKRQFLSLVTFQNSGYLPLALAASVLPPEESEVMFVYIFLFLLGFNLIIWSFGVQLVSYQKAKGFELASLFSPPVIATLFSLALIFFGLNKIIPAFILKPLRMAGECTVPLAMLVVGGNLAQIHLRKVDKKAVSLIILAKMLILPALGLILVLKLGLPELIGLLVIMQLAVPSATSLSLIMRHYQKEDLLISQGILFSHIVAIISLPVFLSLYFILSVVK